MGQILDTSHTTITTTLLSNIVSFFLLLYNIIPIYTCLNRAITSNTACSGMPDDTAGIYRGLSCSRMGKNHLKTRKEEDGTWLGDEWFFFFISAIHWLESIIICVIITPNWDITYLHKENNKVKWGKGFTLHLCI